jgi:TonB-dependent receptor
MKRACCLILLIVVSHIVYAQAGKISGKVISAGSGQPLSGATLTLVEKARTKAADQNGAFSFNKLEAGTYSIKCTYVGYDAKIVDEIIVKDNDNTDISISLDVTPSGEVIVRAPKRLKAAGATVESLLSALKSSANIGDGVTEQTIKRTPDSKSSDVIKRVSGASIQDDKFAIIRGLNDRYNAAFINGAPLPSTESDRKAFSFDIFPSAILDNLIIYKTATPDKTGEFAGGIIEVTTKSAVSKGFTTFAIGQGYNSLLTGKTRYFSEAKGKKDWLGIDDGARGVPVGLPAEQELRNITIINPEERLKLAKLFKNIKWGVKNANTRPNFNFQLAKGFNIERKEKEFLSAVFSINYNRTFTLVAGDRNQYNNPTGGMGAVLEKTFNDSTYNEEIIWAALGNIAIKINNRNNISWKNNFSVNTDNKLVRRIGLFDVPGSTTDFLKETGRLYTQDQIYTTQLIGEHQIGSKKTKINWLAGYSKVDRKIPNICRTQYFGSYPDVNTTYSSIPATASSFGATGGMFSTNSNENIKSLKIDITQPYTFMKNTQNFIKVGAGYQLRSRVFTSRNLGFSGYGGLLLEQDQSIGGLPEDQIFLEQNLGIMANGKAGISISDGTFGNSGYEASSAITHAYIMNDQRFFKKFRLIYGVRFESFNQKLSAPGINVNAPLRLDSTVADFLPSANLVYEVTPKINLRLSYTETLNRPEFRELAPFLFYEFVSGFNTGGDTLLRRAKIKNYDFRFEYYPGKVQLLSFSAFYKKFTNPIELSRSDVFSSEVKYENSASATVYGVEAEFRVLLATLFGIKNDKTFLSRFMLSGNAAFMKSSVVAQVGSVQAQSSRPLQGQSPYLLNGSLGYSDDVHGLSSTISVNRVGDRLAIAGSGFNANIYEKARTVVDFQIAKSLLKNKVEIKFNAKDILAQKIIIYYDFNKSASYKEEELGDRIFTSNVAPKVFSFTATFKL